MRDLAKLYALGASGVMFGGSAKARDAFMDNLIHHDESSASFHNSKIRSFYGNYKNGAFRKTVEIEAALMGRTRFVDEFMKHLVWRDKGGAGSSGNKDYAESGFGILSVPHKVNGKIVMRHYAMGIFTDRIDLPSGCNDDAACAADLSKSRAVQNRLMHRELPIEPIRRALQSWTLFSPNSQAVHGQINTRIVRP